MKTRPQCVGKHIKGLYMLVNSIIKEDKLIQLGENLPNYILSSIIKRGDRRAKREHVVILAQQLNASEEELLSLWLADKIIDAIDDDSKVGLNALNVVCKELSFQI